MVNYRIEYISSVKVFWHTFICASCTGGVAGLALGTLGGNLSSVFAGLLAGLIFGLLAGVTSWFCVLIFNVLTPFTGGICVELLPVSPVKSETPATTPDQPPPASCAGE